MIVTEKQLIDFIYAQPKDRAVNFSESSSQSECGCVMVQFGKEELKIEKYFKCDFDSFIGTKFVLDKKARNIIINFLTIDSEKELKNYGELQKVLDKQKVLV